MKKNISSFSLLRRLALIAVFLLGIVTSIPARSQGNTPLFEIIAPGQVAVGEPIELMVTAKHVADIAGYETVLLFDTTVAEFGGLRQRQNDLKKIARDVSPLAAIDLPNGVAFGLFSCPVENCVTRQGPKKDRGANGLVNLGTITLYPNAPGSLEIKVDATKFVDAAGNPFAVTIVNPIIVVQVETAEPYYPAPGSMWALPASAPPDPGPFDLTGDGMVTHADAMEVSIEWEITRLNLAPCSPEDPSRDVNHDGCIDVADLQLVAAHYDTSQAQLPNSQSAESLALNADVSSASLTFTVNATADGADASIGDGVCATAYGYCTLRAAIQEVNAHSGPDTINFNIWGTGIKTIQLKGRLPTLNDESGPTTIDGYTQPGSAPNTDSLVSNASLRVQVAGNGEDRHEGLVITSSGNVIRGLAFFKLKRAIWIYGSGATSNVVTGTFIGTDAAGSYGAAALVTGAHGMHIEQGAASNRIGGTSAAERNVISGNAQSGVGIWHEQSDANVIYNNLIGLKPAGNGRLPNRKHAIDLNFGSSSNTVGGTASGQRNVCSGNDTTGIEVSHTAGTTNNQVVGNFIGTDATGTRATSWSYNGYTGITLEDGVTNNTISHNVIGSNQKGGIQITGFSTTNNHIHNNRIGVSTNGSAIGNSLFGIRADGRYSLIGPGNIVAYNQYTGIVIRENDKDFNKITQNSVHNNGALGIDLLPNGVTPNDSGDTDIGPNENLNFPVLSRATTQQVAGTACGGCTVEVFIADSGAGFYGEGKTLIGSGTADGSGAFTVAVSGVSSGAYVTSTATDSAGNTSEFSLNLLVSGS